nr:helix-turn-helix transcriptional regulator [Gulbenkiania mobilis]
MTAYTIPNLRQLRYETGLTQKDFWDMVGVTQSAGSRYESGRAVPKQVLELVRIVHIERIDLAKINRDDLDVIDLLKEVHPDLISSLRTGINLRAEHEAQQDCEPS